MQATVQCKMELLRPHESRSAVSAACTSTSASVCCSPSWKLTHGCVIGSPTCVIYARRNPRNKPIAAVKYLPEFLIQLCEHIQNSTKKGGLVPSFPYHPFPHYLGLVV